MIQIVVSKLHIQTAMDFDRRHYRAAKALVVVIPMLGFTYLLTLLGPSATHTPTAYAIFQAVRAVLLSTQGAVITLPYCYFNTEVQSILTTRWNRWRMIKTLESECLSSTRKSSLAAHSLNGEVCPRFSLFPYLVKLCIIKTTTNDTSNDLCHGSLANSGHKHSTGQMFRQNFGYMLKLRVIRTTTWFPV